MGSTSLTRRQFVVSTAAAAAAAGGLSLAACADGANRLVAPESAIPDGDGVLPEHSPIQHIVVVMMENRSFDHLLGWLPRADGRQAGLSYRDRNGEGKRTFPLAPDFQGCSLADPDHSFEGGRVEYNGGACDGWLRAGDNDEYAIGYYRREDLPFLGQAAPDWTSFDRYFCAFLGPTLPNRIYQHAGQTDRLSNTVEISTLPTIWDRLSAKGLRGRYYFSDLSFLSLWGNKYRVEPQAISFPIARFYADCEAGTLPEVAFVDPAFLGDDGTANSDHPHGDIRAGDWFLNRIYEAVTRSPAWPGTILVITFDEWGGFFDHVPPTPGPVTAAEQLLGHTDGLRGFRIPVLVISPFARRHFVSHEVFDHTSILKLIEWRWNLPPLALRDAAANNLASVLRFNDFRQKRRPPRYPVPEFPAGAACRTPGVTTAKSGVAPTVGRRSHWIGLQALAREHGWPD